MFLVIWQLPLMQIVGTIQAPKVKAEDIMMNSVLLLLQIKATQLGGLMTMMVMVYRTALIDIPNQNKKDGN